MVRSISSTFVRRVRNTLVVTAMVGGVIFAPVAAVGTAASAAPLASDNTTFSVATPQLTSITDGTSQAPWNVWQGDSSAAPCSFDQLFPTYDPGTSGCPTTTTQYENETTGALTSITEPNFAVYPGANSGTDSEAPYPDGAVGTPGPLDDYCGSGNATAETTPTSAPTRQPQGQVLPMSPYYFPHIVRNADGSLTGYFDYRPKDADEAIVVASSTDNGVNWTYEGEALEQNPGYCPSSDSNDDGEGHPDVLSVGSNSYLYTLQRAAGDNAGVGLLVHSVNPTAANPLASVPAVEQVGVDPDSPATASDTVSTTASSISVQQTDSSFLVNGQPTSPEELVPGPFVDLTKTPYATAADVITCTGVTATTLNGCTTPSGTTINVAPGDLIEQSLATVVSISGSKKRIQAGPNNGATSTDSNVDTTGDGGTGTVTVTPTNTLLATIINDNAPNRVYMPNDVAGQTSDTAVYCSQSNASGTKLEDCSTGPAGSNFATLSPVANDPVAGSPVLADPIVPTTAQQTSGLVSPDGIVGVLPTYPGAPTGSTIVMYTEKELNYFVAGTTTNATAVAFSSGAPTTISFNPSPYETVDLPSTISAGSPVTLEIGATNTAVGGTPVAPNVGGIIPVTCTGLTNTSGTAGVQAVDTFTGCTVPSADNGMTYSPTAEIGTAGATTVPESTLALTGEGDTKSTSAAKLWKNNEDLEVLRVAYTTDGVNFSSAGLANGGIISGASNSDSSQFNPSSPSSDNFSGSNYADISNPEQTVSPSNLNAYSVAGTQDASEMRWVGSTGTIITNPDGSIGLFINGAFAADGDSDAFNQVFYTSSTDGENWTTPVSVVSTDYTFQASVNEDASPTAPLGITAYYSGRAYNPTIVPNADGTLTMLFSGYRTPGNPAVGAPGIGDGASTYSPSANDPDLYRTILQTTLTPTSTTLATSTTTVTASPTTPVVGQPVTYTATETDPAASTIVPTGTVTFSDANGTLCSAQPLVYATTDTATCTVPFDGGGVSAVYSGDANYATSTGNLAYGPSAPSITSATAGNASVTLDWTAPTNDGGSAVTGYTVTETDTTTTTTTTDVCGSQGSDTSLSTTCTISGLNNGDNYTFEVAAINAVATGAFSTPSNSVTPLTTPGAPTGVTAVPGNSAVVVSWTAPTSTGGSPITGYVVNAIDSTNVGTTLDVCGGVGGSDTSTTTSCSVSGLNDGDSYTFDVAAINAAGTGTPSTASSPVTFLASPTAPSIVSVVPGNASAVVTWSTPTSTGGSAITGYTVTATDTSSTTTTTDVCGTQGSDSSTSTTCTVEGLTNGDNYTFEVAAINGVGAGAFSSPSDTVTPYTTPGAPSVTTLTQGNGDVVVAWTAPTSDGGSAVTGYTVDATDTSNGNATTLDVCGPSSDTSVLTTCTVSGLTDGDNYTFEVAAINAAGPGTLSGASSSVTFVSSPPAPSITTVTPGNASVVVTWTAPSADGGSSITGYTVTATDLTSTATISDACGSGGSDTSTATTCTVGGLNNGDSYSFQVAAINSVGTGASSDSSSAVTPFTKPGVPTILSAVPGNSAIVVTWSAPTTDGGNAVAGYTVNATNTTTSTTSSDVCGPDSDMTAELSCSVGGLVDGDAYTFEVAAINLAGTGTFSAASSPAVTFVANPQAPSITSAMPGNGTIALAWAAPTSDGGSAITGYVVNETNATTNNSTSDVCGPTSDGSTITNCTIGSLTNGDSYTFQVAAVNNVGQSPFSSPSSPATPYTTPGAPSITSVVPGNSSASLVWTAPLNNGGDAVSGYTVTALNVTTNATMTDACPASVSSAGTSCTVDGLTNGDSYVFEVAGINLAGPGAFSSTSSPEIPYTTPNAPSIASVKVGVLSALVSWTAPSNDGGSAVTGYTVTASNVTTNTVTTDACGPASDGSTSLSCTVANLSAGDSYTFTVAGINAAGAGAFSSSSSAVVPLKSTLSVVATGSQTYHSTAPTFLTTTSAPGGDSFTGTLRCTTLSPTKSISSSLAVGSYTIAGASCTGLSLSGPTAGNYTIAYSGGTFAVTPLPITVVATGKQTFGSTPTFTTISTAPAGDRFSGSLSCSSVGSPSVAISSSLAVGGYTINGSSCMGLSFTGPTSTDYSVAYSGGGFTVTPGTLTVIATGSQAYHSTSPTFATTTSAPAGDSFTGTLVCTTVTPNKPISPNLAVGNYTVAGQTCSGLSLSGPTASDYSIAYSGGTFSVTGLSLTVNATGTQTYGSSTPTFTTTTSAPAGDRFAGTLRCTSLSSPSGAISSSLAVGSDTINGASCSGLTLTGATGADYSITYGGGAFNVTPATFSVVASGSQVYRSSAPTFTTKTAAPAGDSFTGTLVCTKVEPSKSISSSLALGTYTILGSSCSGLGLSGPTATDYSIAYTGGVFTVKS